MGFENDDQLIQFNHNNDNEDENNSKFKASNMTLMGDLNENEQIKFNFDDNKDENENEDGNDDNDEYDDEEIDILNEGITLMGINNENENVEFIKLKEIQIDKDKDDINVIIDDIDTINTETLQ